ncbi:MULTISPECIES: Bug family tripartite tricarboxylate transporter substrate binding protein [Alcaligenaceae]|uniref:Bug family tripartite tricarboxylate transporter substrate binding protein n=1 Tax=Bordetella genomosp. 10 TaxID=1416804 RepID=UPI00211B0DD5|nr:tripartite tricarboxylate transporter substrate binding protein [Bordetella genomosp. 10]
MQSKPISPARRHLVATAAAIAATLSLPGLSHAAEAWPTKPIRYIVPFGAGGLADAVARAIAQPLSERLGQPIVVENRAGVSGVLGTQLAARAAPDGYTLVGGTITTHAVVPFFNKSIGYDPVKDFAPVSLVGTVTNVLVVNESSPYRSLADLLADLRAHPDTLTYGTAGPGTTQHLAGELLQSLTGTRMRQVPYKGGTQAMTDLMGGQITMTFETSTVARPLIEGHRVRALGSTAPTPIPNLPGVVPIASQGVPGFDVQSWQGVFAPAGTPPAVVDKLAENIDAVLRMPEVRQHLAQIGMQIAYKGPADFARYQSDEIVRWGKLLTAAGIKPE